MVLEEIRQLLKAQVLIGEDKLSKEVYCSCASDLMSNVLMDAGEKSLLITSLNNLQVVRTAEMRDIEVIVFVQNKRPSLEVLELAREQELVLLVTPYTMFTTCGILFKAGLRCGLDDGR